MSESVESEWWSQTKFPWFDLEKHKFLCYFGTPIYSLDTLWTVLKKKMFWQKGTWQFLNIFMLNTAFQGMLFLSPSIFVLNLNLQYLLMFNAFRQLVVRIPFLVCKLPVIQVLATVGINSMAFPWGCFFKRKRKNPPKNPSVVRSNKAMCDRWVGWWLGWVEHWSTLILVVTPPKLDPENWWDWKTSLSFWDDIYVQGLY